jgi:hypothetical protein
MLMGLVAAAAMQSAVTNEWIGRAELPGFVEGHRVERPYGMIVEWVPEGETVQNWTRIITVQRFGEAATRQRPREVIANMARDLSASCPGGVPGAVETLRVSGRQAARFRADCALNPGTGLPETLFALAIAGERDMHMFQIAFRRVPSAEDVSWAEQHLSSAALCTDRSPEPVCRR